MSPQSFDLTTLSADGQELEQLTRDLLLALGYRAAWSGRGPDGGKDLMVQETTSADFGAFPRKWLVACKHFAVSGRSVGYEDVGDVPGRLQQHGCQGFLLVTTTQPSSGLIDTFEAWSASTQYLFHYWDAPTLRRLLLRDGVASITQVYFPAPPDPGQTELGSDLSGDQPDAHLEAGSFPTENEMLSYLVLEDGRSFYFQVRKEPDDGWGHRSEFELAIDHLRSRLPRILRFAIRGVYYDDKHGSYHWQIAIGSHDNDFEPDLETLQERLSEVLVEPGSSMGQWHDFEFRRFSLSQLGPVTPRAKDEKGLQLFSSWP